MFLLTGDKTRLLVFEDARGGDFRLVETFRRKNLREKK